MSTSFQILYCVLVRYTRTPNQTVHGETDWRGSKVHRNTETCTELTASQWNSSGIFSQDSPHCSSVKKSKSLLLKLSETPENFTGRIIFMSMFNDTSCGSRDNEKECESNAQLGSLHAKRFGARQWSFLGPGSEKKWYSISEDSPQDERDKMAEKMMLEFAESGHPILCYKSIVQRSAQKQSPWKIVDTLLCRFGDDSNCFSHNYFCNSAQSSRSSRRFLWWIQCLSSKNGETRAGRIIEFLIRAKRDQDRTAFGLWRPCSQRSSIATIWRTNWKVITTRQIEQILYGCRISECCWNRTVFHDKRYCRIITILRCSGLSWVHFAKRRRYIWTERLDQREHQNCTRIGSYNLLPAR